MSRRSQLGAIHRGLAPGLMLLTLLSLPSQARAAPPADDIDGVEDQDSIAADLVLIRVVPDRPDVRARLQAELGLLGFVSERLELDGEALGADLLDSVADGPASAAIELEITPTRINMWIADVETGKSVYRRLDPSDGDQGEPRTIAIAAVELLRASRLEALAEAADKDGGPGLYDELPGESSEPEEPPQQRPLRAAISLGPQITASPGGFGVSTHVEIAARWAPLPRFALRFSLWVPTLGNRLEGDSGLARVFIGMAFVEPQLRLPGGAPWFHPELGLGVGGAVLGISGEAADNLARGNADVLGSFAAYGHGGLGFAASPRFWIRIDGFVGIAQPQPVITSHEVEPPIELGRWGLPWGGGGVGIEIWL